MASDAVSGKSDSPAPNRSAVGEYFRGGLRHDMVAGATVAIMGVPQGMAYAWIAGLPPIYGLYTSIVSCIVGALTGSSRHLLTGPTNASCMVIFSVTAPYMALENHVEVVFFLGFLAGLIKLAFGLLRLGGIVRYVSNSVLIGFTTGVAILIVGNQLKNVLGVSIDPEVADRFYKVLYETLRQIPSANPWPLSVASFTLAAILIFQLISKRLPGLLFAMVLAAGGTYIFDLHSHGVLIVRDIAQIPESLAIFHVPEMLRQPSLAWIERLSAGALAVALFGLIEASSSARAVSALSGQRLAFSREFVGQGLANIVGAFFMNFASSGSFVRTALNYQAGARTRFAAVFSALFIALVIILLAPWANYIPQASLAGVLFYVAGGMLWKQRERIAISWRSSKQSRRVFIVTLLSTLIMPLQYAIFVGVFLSIVFLLRITGKVDLTCLVARGSGRFDEVPFEESPDGKIALVNIEGDLYFAAVENLDYDLQRALSASTRVVVLRMKRLRAVGSTAMTMLEHFRVLLAERGIVLVVCGVEKSLAGLMRRSGLSERIGEANIFYADNTLFQATELALARARAVVDMEEARQGREQKDEVGTPKLVVADDLLSRQCVRFGQGHSMREAVWLMSEMNRRNQSLQAAPLFLQDTDGVLAGVLTPWHLLDAMAEGLSEEEAEGMDDAELGGHYSKRFRELIQDLARKDYPFLGTRAPVVGMVLESAGHDYPVLPVCDVNGRVLGLVDEDALLKGVGRMLHLVEPQTGETQSKT